MVMIMAQKENRNLILPSVLLRFYLLLDGVEALELVVYLCEVVRARCNGGDVALGLEVLLEMSVVAEIAELGRNYQ